MSGIRCDIISFLTHIKRHVSLLSGSSTTVIGNVASSAKHKFSFYHSRHFLLLYNIWHYCTISINSSPHVTRDASDEILVWTTSQTCHDILKFLANFWQFSAAGDEKFLYLACNHQMNSSPYKISVTTVTFRRFGGPHDA